MTGATCGAGTVYPSGAPDFTSGIYEGLDHGGTEKRLFRDLFGVYDTVPRPINNISEAVIINFGIALNQILDLDEKKQVMTTSVWISEEWRDENLQWDPKNYDGLDTLMIASTHVWIPDIFIFNTAGGELDGFVNVTGSKVMIKRNGQIRWAVPLMIKSACSVDVTYFPYDNQRCVVNFGSWIHDGSKLDLYPRPSKPDLTEYMQNSEFDLLDVTLERTVVNESCCPGPGKHPMIHFGVKIQRKSIYYDYIVIAPTIMLCVLTLATFFLPCHHGEKISIGLTVFLTLYVLQLLIAENVPDTNTTPVLGIFIFLVMTLNCISLIMATLVMIIKKHAGLKPVPMVPPWILWFCEKCLSKIICTKLKHWEYHFNLCDNDGKESKRTERKKKACLVLANPSGIQHQKLTDEELESFNLMNLGKSDRYDGFERNDYATFSDTKMTCNMCKYSQHIKRPNGKQRHDIAVQCSTSTTPLSQTHPNSSQDIKQRADDIDNNAGRNIPYKQILRNRRSYRKAVQTESLLEDDDTGSPDSTITTRFEKNVLIARSRAIMERKRQWYYVAEAVDKASFLVYMFSMFVTIMTILVIFPSTRT